MLKDEIKTLTGEKHHSAIDKMVVDYRAGKVDRREFLRTATLLGVTSASAYALAGIVEPNQAQASGNKGGVFKYAAQCYEVADPANFAQFEQAVVTVNVCDHVCMTGVDGVTRPHLAESWQANDDLTVWTFNIRKGIKWHNGDKFDASDIKHNIERWIALDSKSSNKSFFANLDKIATPNEYTLVMTFKQPILSVPEGFYNYPTAILHKSFDGKSNWAKNGIGTGPFKLVSHEVGKKVVMKRNDDYWGDVALLDRVELHDLSEKTETSVAALISNQIDAVHEVSAGDIDILNSVPGIKLAKGKTASTNVMRMNVKHKPYDNKKLRQAILACVDQEPYYRDALRGNGYKSPQFHMSEVHPEYPGYNGHKQDYKKAKRLLREAGYPDGIELEITTGNTVGAYEQDMCQILARQVAKIGIKLKIRVMPSSKYWEVWTIAPFAITNWGHRTLGIMVWNLAYKSGVPWNESAYSSSIFDKLLAIASGIADPVERSRICEKAAEVLYDDAVIIQPHFRELLAASSERVANFFKHPQSYMPFNYVSFK